MCYDTYVYLHIMLHVMRVPHSICICTHAEPSPIIADEGFRCDDIMFLLCLLSDLHAFILCVSILCVRLYDCSLWLC